MLIDTHHLSWLAQFHFSLPRAGRFGKKNGLYVVTVLSTSVACFQPHVNLCAIKTHEIVKGISFKPNDKVRQRIFQSPWLSFYLPLDYISFPLKNHVIFFFISIISGYVWIKRIFMLLRLECNYGLGCHLHFNVTLNVKWCLLWAFELKKPYEEIGYVFRG